MKTHDDDDDDDDDDSDNDDDSDVNYYGDMVVMTMSARSTI